MNGRAKSGGSIYLIETENRKNLLKSKEQRYSLTNTQIYNSLAIETNGGAIVLSNIQNMLIETLKIYFSSANTQGGGIFTECDSPAYNCKLTFKGTNIFSGCSANVSGGAIYYSDNEPVYSSLSQQFSFSNNSAVVYGNNIGTYA